MTEMNNSEWRKKTRTDLIGKSYGRLMVLSREIPKFLSGKNRQQWLCICECGVKKVIPQDRLKSGQTKSCGCINKERLTAGKHLKSNTAEYRSWCALRYRCLNKNRSEYKHYGGRGIKVCDRWKSSFENFFSDMGPKPTSKHSIDRINNNGNYEPSNCKWATMREQNLNRRKPSEFIKWKESHKS